LAVILVSSKLLHLLARNFASPCPHTLQPHGFAPHAGNAFRTSNPFFSSLKSFFSDKKCEIHARKFKGYSTGDQQHFSKKIQKEKLSDPGKKNLVQISI